VKTSDQSPVISEREILRCLYRNKCKEADESFQKVYCAQRKEKTGFRLEFIRLRRAGMTARKGLG
jgi:hypothetical protein